MSLPRYLVHYENPGEIPPGSIRGQKWGVAFRGCPSRTPNPALMCASRRGSSLISIRNLSNRAYRRAHPFRLTLRCCAAVCPFRTAVEAPNRPLSSTRGGGDRAGPPTRGADDVLGASGPTSTTSASDQNGVRAVNGCALHLQAPYFRTVPAAGCTWMVDRSWVSTVRKLGTARGLKSWTCCSKYDP